MDNKQEFKWTDELVKEFVEGAIRVQNSMPHEVSLDLGILHFKKSKEHKVEEKRTEVVGLYVTEISNTANYCLTLSEPMLTGKYEAVKQAIERELNNDTVEDKEGVVSLLTACVSATWGNPSLDKTQVLYDKFLYDRKLAKPSQQLVNAFISDAVNRNMYDKKYSQSEVDAIRKEAFEAARLMHPLAGMKYDTFEDYQKSLPENQPQESKQDSKPKQMWNKHTGVHDESVLCTGMKCQEYNPINIEHK